MAVLESNHGFHLSAFIPLHPILQTKYPGLNTGDEPPFHAGLLRILRFCGCSRGALRTAPSMNSIKLRKHPYRDIL